MKNRFLPLLVLAAVVLAGWWFSRRPVDTGGAAPAGDPEIVIPPLTGTYTAEQVAEKVARQPDLRIMVGKYRDPVDRHPEISGVYHFDEGAARWIPEEGGSTLNPAQMLDVLNRGQGDWVEPSR
jgi:hypothetical protein